MWFPSPTPSSHQINVTTRERPFYCPLTLVSIANIGVRRWARPCRACVGSTSFVRREPYRRPRIMVHPVASFSVAGVPFVCCTMFQYISRSPSPPSGFSNRRRPSHLQAPHSRGMAWDVSWYVLHRHSTVIRCRCHERRDGNKIYKSPDLCGPPPPPMQSTT